MKSLAIKYRPIVFDDVVEQSSIKVILQEQIRSKTIKNGYLFVGSAGTGKTTCARIFANEINEGHGTPIEMDAASNNSVDDIRNVIAQAQTKSLDSEYKIFIIDEAHSLSNSAWQAMLKTLEEPPAKSIFIFATTDPQKIPKTILSRVQRYDFQRISQKGIVDRLNYIIAIENNITPYNIHMDTPDAIEYIAKIADGGMRDAITLMDKCLAYSKDLTLENVVKALGTTDYDTMFKLTDRLIYPKANAAVQIVEELYNGGKDLKTFVRQYVQFLLDLSKWGIGCDWKYLTLPRLDDYEQWLKDCWDNEFERIIDWLSVFVNLNADIKWSQSVKYDIEAAIVLACDTWRDR